MNLLILSLVTALLGEKTEKLQGGKKVGHERRIWKTHKIHSKCDHTCGHTITFFSTPVSWPPSGK